MDPAESGFIRPLGNDLYDGALPRMHASFVDLPHHLSFNQEVESTKLLL